MVLDRPQTSLHTNASENDIRCYVTRRKVSAGTRSEVGRDCRDAFLSLAKTCDKLGVALWDYLGSRFRVALWPGWQVCDEAAPLPLGDGFWVDAVARGQDSQALLTMLDRLTDCRRRCGGAGQGSIGLADRMPAEGLLWRIWPIMLPSTHVTKMHHQTMGPNI